jgi:HD-GYP domain-containing protein (c-di-GMP phosphodiesterase class II)
LAGDELLSRIGRIIRNALRSTDQAFRYGGDEFAVILPETTLDGAIVIGERLRKEIEANANPGTLPVTCSIGIASFPEHGAVLKETVRKADDAMYHAKQSGRNRVCVASGSMPKGPSVSMVVPNTDADTLSTIRELAAAMEAKDHYTYGHCKRVSDYAADIAVALGYSDVKVATIRIAALLHDVGKIGLSDEVLMKPGRLTDDEWVSLQTHPRLSGEILGHVDSLKNCLAAVRYHHERYDGDGYPEGLRAEQIPLDARILAVADAYDAMTSLRPYRHVIMSREQAFAELRLNSGSQFDPNVVDAFIEIIGPTQSTETSGSAIASNKSQ